MQRIAAALSAPTAALLAAGLVTVTPVGTAPPALSAAPPATVRTLEMADIQLTASAIDILRLPALRQWLVNLVDDVVTLGIGLTKSAEGIGKTILAFPDVLVDVTRLLLDRDPAGALARAEEYLVGAIAVIGAPTLAAIVERRERYFAVASALQTAVPEALITLGVSLLDGFNAFAAGVITGTQNFVDSLWPISIPGYIPGIVNALIDGTVLSIRSLGAGAQIIIDGIVAAQNIFADGLAAGSSTPPAVPEGAASRAAAPSITSIPTTATTTVTLTDTTDVAAVDTITDDTPKLGTEELTEPIDTTTSLSVSDDEVDAGETQVITESTPADLGDDATEDDPEPEVEADEPKDSGSPSDGDSGGTENKAPADGGSDADKDAPAAAA